MLKRICVILVVVFAQTMLSTGPVRALDPSELLADPALEERARELSKGLRCLVCRNESIDDSNAELAKDLRRIVRERLVSGDSDDEVLDYVVGRYGEFVLLKPPATGANLLLYIAGPAMLGLGLLVAVFYIRGRRGRDTGPGERLSAEEQARLKEIMGD
ncbi:cytochrome c-type biogenesis protein [Rhodovulum steppense]|uniref:Cytochrome c-type biogenesis protein n=1 Tax=Rhodovulum steppense TaxID=540251 RepID=A0A4R1YK43_9RHOB|nr:cytochrome c-type biogenesis protein [Rhodovulum steppense]TCM77346.1 cytochrome c-type biogenesis protein CcmH [Rhodovulum steppense]